MISFLSLCRMNLPVFLTAIFLCLIFISPADAASRHGISIFGDLKYSSNFTHFDYVNPNAPKGGALRIRGTDTFDSLNPFILRGVAPIGINLIFDTLMVRAVDEPDALYGLIAESVELSPDRTWMEFTLRPSARFNDGSPITVEDVVFTFETLKTQGHPRYSLGYQSVKRVEITSPNKVKFSFKNGDSRELPTQIAGLPIISKSFYSQTDFNSTSVDAPLGSGPYKVHEMEIGRYIVYQRDEKYWAKNLPVNKGRYNFDQIRVDYYRDRAVAFEAFMAGEYDFHEEFVSKRWATQYDKPPVNNGQIVRETLPDNRPSGVQAFFFNLRKPKFQDRKVRQALNLAFDFEWTNKRLFFDLYRRTNSMFENSKLAANSPPSADEIKLLEPFRAQLPPEVFTQNFRSPQTPGTGNNRKNLIQAMKLLEDAGWTVRNNVLVNQQNQPFTIEFLISQSTFQRIIGPYTKNLNRLGIRSRIRIVDTANFQQRRQNFDFDIIMQRFVQPITPGLEQRNYFGSASADIPGSRNYAGIKNPVVDALINNIITASTRDEITIAGRALDRVLMWNYYLIPQWFKGTHNIAYWNKFGRPKVKADFSLGVLDTWWFDNSKYQELDNYQFKKTDDRTKS